MPAGPQPLGEVADGKSPGTRSTETARFGHRARARRSTHSNIRCGMCGEGTIWSSHDDVLQRISLPPSTISTVPVT